MKKIFNNITKKTSNQNICSGCENDANPMYSNDANTQDIYALADLLSSKSIF